MIYPIRWLVGVLVLSVLGANVAWAQHVVTGRVTSSETLQPIAGALVTVQGTTAGSLTNAQGEYTIQVPENASLQFSMIGYSQQVVPVEGRTVIDVSLQPTALQLDELIAVGYTTQSRRSVAGAVATVQASAVESRQVATVQDALRGRIAGVNVRNSGQPGEAAVVDIRGRAFSADNNPLYVVDGMYMDDIRNLNPNDIESLQVLKDASAASQYGARAANGVIVVTTKRGQASDQNRITLSSSYGFQKIPRLIPMMNSVEWANLYYERYTNSLELDPTSAAVPAGVFDVLNGINTYDTDWQKEVTRPGHLQDHVLSLSGGTTSGNANYFVSGGYTENVGTLLNTDFKRYTLRVNSTLRRGRLTLNENLMLARANQRKPGGTLLGSATRMFPSIPVYNDNNFGPDPVWATGTANYPTFAPNAVGQATLNDDTEQRTELIGTLSGQVDLLPGLAYRLQGGFRYTDVNADIFNRSGIIAQNAALAPTALTISSDVYHTLLIEHLLSFDRSLGVHAINATAGFTQERNDRNFFSARRTTFATEDLRVLPAGSQEIANDQERSESRLNSYLARVSYSLKDRYLVEANFRRDGSSRFGPANRWGNFWSGALGWILSDEEFFQAIPVLGNADYLKLRASYGTQGNQDFADYEWQSLVVQSSGFCCGYIRGPGEGVNQAGLMSVSMGNPLIRWQANTMMNLGVDLGLLDNRLSLTAEYYVSESDGVLARVPLIPSLGSQESPFVNAAAIRNSGVELSLQHTFNRSNLELTSGLNLTTLSNKVLALGGQDEDIIVGPSRTAVGYPLGHFYLMETCGVFRSEAEVEAHQVQPEAQPGDLCFVDHNGDGVITQDLDRRYAGSAFPKLETGIFLDGRYRSFDFRFAVRGAFGQKAYNTHRPLLEDLTTENNAPKWLDPWSPENPDGKDPRGLWGSVAARQGNARGPSDRYLEDNSFIKLQNIQLGYRVPTNLLSGAGLSIENARVYVNLQDIATFTDYLGYDPEFRGGTLTPGEDGAAAYPNPRTITLGIDLGL